MAAVIMSNPLHLAVLGNPFKGKPGSTRSTKGTTMAKRRSSRTKRRTTARKPARKTTVRKMAKRKYARHNPSIAATGKAYMGGLTSTPTKVMGLFKGKGAAKNILFTAGGLAGTYVIGGMISGKLGELTARIPGVGSTLIGQRLIPALVPYTVGFIGSKFIKDQKAKTALLVGGGVASIIELIMPGKVGELLGKVPGLNRLAMGSAGASVASAAQAAEAGPTQQAVEGIGRVMLAGYVDAPSYSGTAGYVDAPSYSGTAGMGSEMLAGYVDAPSYSGTAGLGSEMLAGNYLEDSSMFSPAI